MKKDVAILVKSYKELFLKTMNPIFFTLASYMENTNTLIQLNDNTKEEILSL